MNETRSPAAQRTVVYVEDQPVNVLLMQALFGRRPDLRLLVATTGREAMDTVDGLWPDLLLLDIRLPDCSGTDLLPRLRLHPGCRHVPAIAVTAEHGFRSSDTGFDEVWTKPLRFDWTMGRLAQYLPVETGRVSSNMPTARSANFLSAGASAGRH